MTTLGRAHVGFPKQKPARSTPLGGAGGRWTAPQPAALHPIRAARCQTCRKSACFCPPLLRRWAGSRRSGLAPSLAREGLPWFVHEPSRTDRAPPLARPPHRVEFENQSTRPAVIFHKKLTPGESVSVADRGSELCTLSRRPRDLNARAERKAFSLPGGSGGYAAQFTVAIGDVTTGTNVACVIDTTGPNAGKKFKVVVHGALAPLLIDSYMARALTLHASGCRWPRSRAAPLGG